MMRVEGKIQNRHKICRISTGMFEDNGILGLDAQS